MIKLGITGGIGSGKTVVATFLESIGIPIYIADDRSKILTATSPEIKKALTERFGDELFAENTLNKVLLAHHIFNNEDDLKFVNAVIHPQVLIDFNHWILQYKHKQIVAMEAAILFESGFEKEMDYVITVTAPVEERIDRIIKRSNTTRAEALSRINLQLPDETKCKLADFVIYNDDHVAIIPQIEKIINQITFYK